MKNLVFSIFIIFLSILISCNNANDNKKEPPLNRPDYGYQHLFEKKQSHKIATQEFDPPPPSKHLENLIVSDIRFKITSCVTVSFTLKNSFDKKIKGADIYAFVAEEIDFWGRPAGDGALTEKTFHQDLNMEPGVEKRFKVTLKWDDKCREHLGYKLKKIPGQIVPVWENVFDANVCIEDVFF